MATSRTLPQMFASTMTPKTTATMPTASNTPQAPPAALRPSTTTTVSLTTSGRTGRGSLS